jgi:hypothetical protein
MSVAGDNEKVFIDYFESKFPNILKGKKSFKNGTYEVSISVDNSFLYNGVEILFEIDSGNMAKLLAGQYTLLNNLCTQIDNKIFVVIHYFNAYNPQRTLNNFNLINNEMLLGNGMRYCAFSIESFMSFCEEYSNIGLLVDNLILESNRT